MAPAPMRSLLPTVLAALLALACASAPADEVQGRRPRHHRRATPPELAVLRTRELHAGRLRARVIHARAVRADSGHVRRVVHDGAPPAEAGARESRVEAADIVADEIWADSVEVSHLVAREVHAAEVTIAGRAR